MPRDTWLVFRYAIEPTLRNPVTLAIGVAQPVLYLVLFGPLVTGLDLPGSGGAWQVFLPGLLVMLAVFGAGFAGFALIPEQRAGVLERMRVSPLSRSSLLLGRLLREVVIVLAQAALLLVLAVLLFGVRVPLTAVLLGFALLGLLSATLGAVSYTLALKLTDEYAFAPVVQNLSMPLLLLSGFLIPMEAGPEWLRALSRINPLTYVLDAERALFTGNALTPIVFAGTGVALALAAAAVLWGIHMFRRTEF